MKRQSNPILTAIAAAFLLAACSSSGGGSSSSATKGLHKHMGMNGGGSSVSSGASAAVPVGGVVVGGAISQIHSFKSRALTEANNNLTVLSVDGKKLALTPPEGRHGSIDGYFLKWQKNGDEGVVSDHMKYSRYGIV